MRTAMLAALAAAALAAPEVASYKDHHMFSIKSENKRIEQLLHAEMESPSVAGLDFWTELKKGASEVQVSVPPTSVAGLKSLLAGHNVSFSILDSDIQASFDAQVAGRKGYKKGNLESFDLFEYHTYEEVVDWARDMAAANSDIAELVHVGWSYEEREIIGLRIFGNASLPNKKKILTNYCIHAREWLSTATGVYLTHQFLTLYRTSAEIHHLVDNVEFTFVLVTNPDGYHTTWTTDRMWRKTRSPNAGSTCIGTDPNRNWGMAWSQPGASNNPCSDSYYGASAFSEAETSALSNYLIANGPFQGYIDFHCCGNMWMTPWGYSYDYPDDYNVQEDQNIMATNAISAVRGTQYAYGPISRVIYQASGSTVDWTYADDRTKIVYSVAVELSGQFTSPPSIIGETVPEVFAGFREFAFVVLNRDATKKTKH